VTLLYGGLSLPLPASTSRSLLADADPALYLALDFIAAMIRQYVGDRLVAEAAASDCGAPITDAVASVQPYEPGPFLMQAHHPLPALFLFRHTSKNDYATLSRSHATGSLECDYVLPALTAAQAERILPVRHAIEELLADRIENGQDDAYTPPGGTLGEPVWLRAGIERIDITDVTYAGFDGMGNLYLPALAMTLTVKERHKGAPGITLTGLRERVTLRDADGTTTDPIVDSNLTPITTP
jgi:hypothetical protein